MKIHTKLYLAFSIIALVVGIGTFFYFDMYLTSLLSDKIKSNLQVVAEISEGSYFVFTQNLETRMIDWSSDGYIRNTTEKILAQRASGQKNTALIEELESYFREKKMVYDPSVIIMDVVGKDGLVIASSREGRIGVDEGKEERDYGAANVAEALHAKFGETFIKNAVIEKSEGTEPMMHVTSRIFSTRIGTDGKLLPLDAVLLLHFARVDQLSSMLRGDFQAKKGALSGSAFSKIYKSGEIYLVGSDGTMLTSLSGVNGTATTTTKKVSAYLASTCFKDSREVNEQYTNYGGISVFGATMCIKRDGVMLVAEVKSSEVLAPLSAMRWAIIAGILFTLVVIVVSSVLFSNLILRPLGSIIAVARAVSGGKNDVRAQVVSKDEFGYLASVFNAMLDRLEQSTKEIYSKAKELGEKVSLIEKQNTLLEENKKNMLNILEDAQELGVTLRSERDKSSAIISSVNEGLFVVDEKNKVILINPSAEKLLGVAPQECIGKSPNDIVLFFKGTEAVPPEENPIARTLRYAESISISAEDNFYYSTPSGKKFPVVMATSPLETNEVKGAIVVFHDITESKLFDEAKSSFISVASHQLRTPLTSVRWYAEMLLDEDAGSLNAEQKEFAQEVSDGAARLNETINALLVLSRVESGKLQEDPVVIDLKPFVTNIVSELAPLIAQKKLSASTYIDEDMSVTADTFMLHEVFTNLISNSIRYTDDGGTITINCHKVDGAETACSVADNGIGIPENQKGKIFEKFFRADNATNKVADGSGLGLSLAKIFVEKWNGRIWFESTEGKGTTFYFTIPRRP